MVKLYLCIQKIACLNLDQMNGYFTAYFVIVCYRYWLVLISYLVVLVTGTQQRQTI
jgi:hypothetical protein